MTPEDFIKEIKGAGRKPVYVLSGGEPASLGRCLKAAEEAVSGDFRDFNFQVLNVEAGQAGRVLAEASTMPFFVSPRVIILKQPPFNAEDWALLGSYLEDPNNDTSLIIVVDKPDRRVKFFKKATALKVDVSCQPPKGAALRAWVVDEFKNRGVTVSGPVAALIIERAGGETAALLGEIEKLSLYVGSGGSLKAEEVRRLVSLSPNANVFELGEALGRQDIPAALSTLMELLTTEHHLPVLAMMVRHFRLIMLIKIRQASLGLTRLGPEEAKQLGMHPFVLEKTQKQASQWPWKAVAAALEALESANRELVTSPVIPQTIMENLALKLARLRDAAL